MPENFGLPQPDESFGSFFRQPIPLGYELEDPDEAPFSDLDLEEDETEDDWWQSPVEPPPKRFVDRSSDSLQQRAQAFWHEAAKLRFLGDPGGLCRQQSSATTFQFSENEDRQRRTIVGSTTRHEVENFFHPRSYAVRERLNRNGKYSERRGSGAGRSRIFRGDKLPTDLAVIPFWTTPDRIAGFLFVDPNDSQPTALTYKALGRSGRFPREAGAVMLPSMMAPISPLLGDVVFIFVDPILAIFTQLRWLQTNFQPLPIVGVFDDDRCRTKNIWQRPTTQKRVVIGARDDERVLRQALLAGAQISRVSLTAKELIHDPWSPLSSLRRALKKTVSWQKALEWALLRREPDAAVKLITRIGLEPDDQTKFLADCDDAVKKHLGKALDQFHLAPRKRFRRTIVVEWNGGWFDDRTGKRISDSVRITDVLWPIKGGSFMQGYVGSGNTRPFRGASLEIRRRGLLAYLQKHFATQGIQFDFQPGWSGCSDFLASLLHEPRPVPDADLVGWSTIHSRLCLPQFAIGFGGQINLDQRTQLINADSPAQDLAPPVLLQRADVRPLAFDTPTNNLFWAVVVAFVYNILAPAYDAIPIGVVLAGDGANSLAQTIAAAFGCRAVEFSPKWHGKAALQRLNEQLDYYHWPAIVMAESEPPRRAERILTKLIYNTFLTIPTAAVAAARTDGWHLLQAGNQSDAMELLQRFGAPVALNYLRDVLRRHLDVSFHQDGWFRAIWVDLASWFSQTARGRQAVLGAQRCLVTPPCEWASRARITNIEDED